VKKDSKSFYVTLKAK